MQLCFGDEAIFDLSTEKKVPHAKVLGKFVYFESYFLGKWPAPDRYFKTSFIASAPHGFYMTVVKTKIRQDPLINKVLFNSDTVLIMHLIRTRGLILGALMSTIVG